MGTPTNRTPVRIARGSTTALNTGLSDIQEGEIVWDTTLNKLQVKEGSALENHTVDTSTLAALSGADFVGPINVGVDDAGHDVKFFGDTASKYCLWDTSADELDIDGNINISDHATFGGQVNFAQSGGNNILLSEGTGFKQTVSGTTYNVLALDYGKFEAYWQGDKKLETTTSGVTVTGDLEVTNNVKLGDTDKIYFGADDDYEMYQDNDLYLKSNGGHMRHQAAAGVGVLLEGPTGSLAKFIEGGNCELYYDDVKKLETTSSGVTVTGAAVPASITALTSGANVTVNFTLNNNFILTTGDGTIQIDNPTTEVAGQSGSIFIVQGNTPCAAPSWGDQWLFPGGTAPSLTGTTGKIARVDYIVQEAGKIHCVATDDLGAT